MCELANFSLLLSSSLSCMYVSCMVPIHSVWYDTYSERCRTKLVAAASKYFVVEMATYT